MNQRNHLCSGFRLLLLLMTLPQPAANSAERKLLPGHVSRLVTLGVDGRDLRVVHESADSVILAPSWSPDGKWLVFNSQGALWRIPPDGSARPEKIPLGTIKEAGGDHLFAPDGRTIFFSARGHIYAVPFTGGEPRRISNDQPAERPMNCFLHGVSPDGKTLIYTGARRVGNDAMALVDIYTIPAAGGSDVNLTNSQPYDDGPEFSPDGRWIYFNSERDAQMRGESKNYRMAESHIYRMKPDGTGIEQLTRDERVNWFPHPSRDGQWVIYLSYPPLTLGHPADRPVILRRMKPDGSEAIDLIAFNGGQGTINVSSWSPDSRRFAFVMYPTE